MSKYTKAPSALHYITNLLFFTGWPPTSTQTSCKDPHLENKTRKSETNKSLTLTEKCPPSTVSSPYLLFMANPSKIIVYLRYLHFLHSHFSWTPPQSCFCSHHFSEITLLKFPKDIAKSSGHFSVLVLPDGSVVFGTVDYFLFPAILPSLALQDHSVSWFSFCLRICYFSVSWPLALYLLDLSALEFRLSDSFSFLLTLPSYRIIEFHDLDPIHA